MQYNMLFYIISSEYNILKKYIALNNVMILHGGKLSLNCKF